MISPEALTILSKPHTQAFIRERMGHLRYGDWCLMNIGYGIGVEQVIWQAGMGETDDVIRIPLPIDPFNPERGLWEMIDWDLFATLTPRDGEMYIFGMPDRRTKGFCTEWQPPLLALLQALETQLEGGKG